MRLFIVTITLAVVLAGVTVANPREDFSFIEQIVKTGKLCEVITPSPSVNENWKWALYKSTDKEYAGLVITMGTNDRVLSWLYCPNPSSISQMTFNFRKDRSGVFVEISQAERDWFLGEAVPGLLRALNGDRSRIVDKMYVKETEHPLYERAKFKQEYGF